MTVLMWKLKQPSVEMSRLRGCCAVHCGTVGGRLLIGVIRISDCRTIDTRHTHTASPSSMQPSRHTTRLSPCTGSGDFRTEIIALYQHLMFLNIIKYSFTSA